MIRTMRIPVSALVSFGLAALVACGGSTEEAPGPSPVAESSAAKITPPKLKKELPSTCSLLPPDELHALTGLNAKRWKRDGLESENPLLSSCAWRLDGPKPVIVSLVLRTNPNPQKRTAWSRKVLDSLLTEGRTDKKGTQYVYEAVTGLGSQAAWSAEDAQLRWSEGHLYLFTLHTQKADLLPREQFLSLAEAVRAKLHE